MHVDIWVALIGLGGVVYASTVGLFVRKIQKITETHQEKLAEVADIAAREARQKERQVFHASVTSPFYPVKEWTQFAYAVQQFCEQTLVDRVLVLVAVNGVEKPTHASVVWEYRQTGPQFSYVDVPLDPDYCERLSKIKRGGLLRFKTSEAANTLIGGYYATEGVTESIWGLVGTRHSYKTDQLALKYMSVATHNPGGFEDPQTIERETTNLIGRYKGMLYVSGFSPV